MPEGFGRHLIGGELDEPVEFKLGMQRGPQRERVVGHEVLGLVVAGMAVWGFLKEAATVGVGLKVPGGAVVATSAPEPREGGVKLERRV
mgnify:CR=1 FL=1